MTDHTTGNPELTGRAKSSRIPLAAAGLALGMLLSVLDQTVVATALPRIAADLGGLGSISWVATVYLLGSTATAPLYGRISDRYGRRATFIAATGVFTAASGLCGVATSLGQLVVFRALQGIGAGALFVLPAIALSELFPPGQRGRVQGYLGGVFALGSLGGPLAGGLLTDGLSWRWIFYVNLPLGLLSLVLVAAALRLPRTGASPRVDIAGSVLLAAAVSGVILVATWGGRAYPWNSAVILGLTGASAILFVAFGWWERRAADPVLPLHVLTHPVMRTVLPATALLGALLFAAIFFLPTFFQHAYGMTATVAGLALNPAVVALVAASALSGRIAGAGRRLKAILVTGAVVLALGFTLLTSISGMEYGAVAVVIAVCGLGAGLIMQLLVAVAQNSVAETDMAAATSAVTSIRGLGMTLGAAFFGTVLARRLDERGPTPGSAATAVPEMYAWGIPLAVGLVVLLLTLRTRQLAPPGAT